MCTTRSSSHPGGLHKAPLPQDQTPSPRTRPLRDQAPPATSPHSTMHPPPGSRSPQDQAHPPCDQNHRRLWKYNLAPTSLRAVTNANLFVSFKCERTATKSSYHYHSRLSGGQDSTSKTTIKGNFLYLPNTHCHSYQCVRGGRLLKTPDGNP